MEVQVLSTKFVKPSTPTPPLRNIKISFIDQLAPTSHVTCIFYYPFHDQTTTKAVATQLKKSLSETLSLFYSLAGRYNKDNLLVECNDEGGAFWEAKVSGDLVSVVDGRLEPEFLSRFLPCDIGPVDASTTPLVAVQVNFFECGGIAIGVLVSHRVADACTFVTFINAWAKVSRGSIGEVAKPSFELGSLIPARRSPEIVTPTTRRKKGKIVTRRFVFDGATIASLKARSGTHTTRLEAVSALIWRALIAAGASKHGRLRPSLLVHAVSLRGKTGLPIPENTCGNFYTVATARFSPGNSKMELQDLAGLVGEAIRTSLARCAKSTLTEEDLFHEVTKSFGEPSEEWCNEEVDIYMFASWCRFPFFEADFGWGKPIWVSRRHFGVEVISLMDTKCGNGIEAWLGLEEQDMNQFQQDQDIVGFGVA